MLSLALFLAVEVSTIYTNTTLEPNTRGTCRDLMGSLSCRIGWTMKKFAFFLFSVFMTLKYPSINLLHNHLSTIVYQLFKPIQSKFSKHCYVKDIREKFCRSTCDCEKRITKEETCPFPFYTIKIGGKEKCFAWRGKMSVSDGVNECQRISAELPLPNRPGYF